MSSTETQHKLPTLIFENDLHHLAQAADLGTLITEETVYIETRTKEEQKNSAGINSHEAGADQLLCSRVQGSALRYPN